MALRTASLLQYITQSTRADFVVDDFGHVDAAIIISGYNLGQESFCIGFYQNLSSSNQQCSVAIADDHNQTTSNTSRRSSTTDGFVSIYPGDGSVVCDFRVTAINNGIRLEKQTGTNPYVGVQVILFGGLRNAYIGEYNLGTTTSGQDITAPGFKPSLLFLSSIGDANDAPNGTTEAILSFGVAHNNSSDTVSQGAYMCFAKDTQNPTVTGSYASDTYCVGRFFDDALSWGASVSGFDSSGFTITTNVSAASSRIYYLAIELPDPDAAWVDVIDTPTSVTTQAYTGVGFKPSIVGVICGLATALSSATATMSMWHGAFTRGQFYTGLALSRGSSAGIVDVDNVSPTYVSPNNAGSDYVAWCLTTAGATAYKGLAYSVDEDGFTLNFDTQTTGSAHKMIAWAIDSEDYTRKNTNRLKRLPRLIEPTMRRPSSGAPLAIAAKYKDYVNHAFVVSTPGKIVDIVTGAPVTIASADYSYQTGTGGVAIDSTVNGTSTLTLPVHTFYGFVMHFYAYSGGITSATTSHQLLRMDTGQTANDCVSWGAATSLITNEVLTVIEAASSGRTGVVSPFEIPGNTHSTLVVFWYNGRYRFALNGIVWPSVAGSSGDCPLLTTNELNTHELRLRQDTNNRLRVMSYATLRREISPGQAQALSGNPFAMFVRAGSEPRPLRAPTPAPAQTKRVLLPSPAANREVHKSAAVAYGPAKAKVQRTHGLARGLVSVATAKGAAPHYSVNIQYSHLQDRLQWRCGIADNTGGNIDISPDKTSGEVSIFLWGSFDSDVTPTGAAALSVESNAFGSPIRTSAELAISKSQHTLWVKVYNDAGTPLNAQYSDAAVTSGRGKPHKYFVYVPDSMTTIPSLYIDGEARSLSFTSGSQTGTRERLTGPARLRIQLARGLTGFFVAYVWARKLTDSERNFIHLNPYALLNPALPEYLATPRATSGGKVLPRL